MRNFSIGENIATEADLAQLSILLQRLINNPQKTLSSKDLQRVRRNSFLITAFDDRSGLTVGMMTLIPSIQPNGHFGNIEDVCILEDYEGYGLFSKMFKLTCDVARREGIIKLRLTSNPSREHARSIYEHLGFTYHGETGKFTMSLT